ncbi:MAG: hypothetical protein ACRDRW_21730 [Pseudonocardiaceae bacterium]
MSTPDETFRATLRGRTSEGEPSSLSLVVACSVARCVTSPTQPTQPRAAPQTVIISCRPRWAAPEGVACFADE